MSESLTSASIDPVTLRGYNLLRGSCGWFKVEDSGLLRISGEDRKAWLQGQCTNDMRRLATGGSMHFCVCTATGQLVAPCIVFDLPAAEERPAQYALIAPKTTVPALLERAETTVIMEDVQVEDITGEFEWFTVQGPAATSELSELLELPALDAGVATKSVLCLRHDRTGYGGWDLLFPKGAAKKLLAKIEEVNAAAIDICRLEAGIPLFRVDMNEKTLPPEMGPAFEAKHISYTKGCYTGQEVLMRIHSRGHTNKTWVALVVDSEVQPGDIVSHGTREDAGVITCAVVSPRFGRIAGAMVRNEAAQDGEVVQVRSSNGSIEGEVHSMPLLNNFG